MKTKFFNPFKTTNSSTLLIVGLLVALLGSYLAFIFNVRYDGAIDVHFGHLSSWVTVLTDVLISVGSLVVVFYFFGIGINGKTRLLDILNMALIGRIPLYFLIPFNSTNALTIENPENIQQLTGVIKEHLPLLIVMTIVSILLIIWAITLFYNGFKVATNGKGAKFNVLFISAIILAEIVSKLLIFLI